MSQSFSHILTMSFKHEYFKDELFRSLEISYAEDTLKLMRELVIIIKPFRGGFHLLTARPELLAANSNDNPLQLYVNCKDPYYINYTVLPGYEPGRDLIYFNNLNVNSLDGDNELKLHDETYVDEKNILRLTHGKFSIDTFNPDKTYTYKNAAGDLIPNQFIAKESPDSNNIIISNMSQGVIRVFDGNEVVDTLYYNPNAFWKKPLGSIEIFTKALSKHYKNDVKVDYTIHFNSRKTIWKYFLVSEEYKRFKDLTIINSAKEQIFELENDGAEPLVLTSKNKLPLSEHSSEPFQLVDNFMPGQKSETVVIKHLPKPSPEQLYYDNQKPDETMYSHIYL